MYFKKSILILISLASVLTSSLVFASTRTNQEIKSRHLETIKKLDPNASSNAGFYTGHDPANCPFKTGGTLDFQKEKFHDNPFKLVKAGR